MLCHIDCGRSYRHAYLLLCLLSLLMLVPSFVNLGMTLDSIASCFLTMLLCGCACRSHCNMLVLLVSIFVFGVVGVVGLVVALRCHCRLCILIFCDGHHHSQADSSLQCRIIVCARVERCIFVVGLVILGFVRFSLEVHAFHGFGSFAFLLYLSVLFHCLSQRRVGGSYALRVSPAVTRLTVYRRPQV